MKKFQAKKEDFTCEKCGAFVKGDGYTNHCPVCLWSKHVDVNPGDRSATCGGLMEPVAVEGGVDGSLIHKCLLCEHTKRNRIQKRDDFSMVIVLSEKIAKKLSNQAK